MWHAGPSEPAPVSGALGRRTTPRMPTGSNSHAGQRRAYVAPARGRWHPVEDPAAERGHGDALRRPGTHRGGAGHSEGPAEPELAPDPVEAPRRPGSPRGVAGSTFHKACFRACKVPARGTQAEQRPPAFVAEPGELVCPGGTPPSMVGGRDAVLVASRNRDSPRASSRRLAKCCIAKRAKNAARGKARKPAARPPWSRCAPCRRGRKRCFVFKAKIVARGRARRFAASRPWSWRAASRCAAKRCFALRTGDAT